MHAFTLALPRLAAKLTLVVLVVAGFGLNTPPVGSVQFVACAVGKITIMESMKSIWPFYGASVAALLIVTYVPMVSLWLPSLFHR